MEEIEITEQNRKLVPYLEKARGNHLFKEGKFVEASKSYSKALLALHFLTKDNIIENAEEYKDTVFIPCSLNLAACYLKIERGYEQAIYHCTEVLKFQPESIKALYRRAKGYIQGAYLQNAKEDLTKAIKLDQNNKELRQTWDELMELYEKKREFINKVSYSNMMQPSEENTQEPVQEEKKEQPQDAIKHIIQQEQENKKDGEKIQIVQKRSFISSIREFFCKRKS